VAVTVLLSEIQRETLAKLCDTFVPPLEEADDPHGFWGRSASDLAVPDGIEQALGEAGEQQLEGMRRLLDALADEGFNELAQQERERMVHAFQDSSPETLAGLHGLKGLTLMLFYAGPDPETGRNPNWDAVGYPGPRSAPADVPKTIAVRRPASNELVLEADVCVVGSGCGGGVIAGELAQRGRKVVVLEAGGYYNEADFNQL
jgi:hypothetical protein